MGRRGCGRGGMIYNAEDTELYRTLLWIMRNINKLIKYIKEL